MTTLEEELAGHTLRTLRTALRRKQEEVAAALEVVPSRVSELENKGLSREVCERAAERLGAPPEAVDWTLDYLAKLEATARRCGPAGPAGDAPRRERRRIAAEFGRRAGEMMLELREWWDEQLVVAAERQRAEALLARLAWKTPEARRAFVQTSRQYHSWGLALLLCDGSLRAAADSAAEAIEQAELAVLVAELAPGEEAWRARVFAYCLAHLVNALRVQGDLKAADRTWSRAWRYWEKGAGVEVLSEARVLGFGASLRRAQRRFEEGLELIERALAVDPGEQALRLLIIKSTLLRERGDLEAALAVLKSGEPLLASADDPRLVLAARLNTAECLTVLGLLRMSENGCPSSGALQT